MEGKTFSFRAIFETIYLFFKSHIKLLALAFVTSMIFAIVKYIAAENEYETSISMEVFEKAVFIGILDNLDELIQKNNINDVMRILGVDFKTAENIVNIKTERSFVTNLTDQKKNEVSNFIVKVRVKEDSTLLNNASQWMTYVTEHNTYMKELFQNQEQYLKSMLKFYEKRILEIDSLEKREVKVQQGQIVLENTLTLPQKKIELYQAKLDLETKLFFHRPIITIEKFESKIRNEKIINFLINIIVFMTVFTIIVMLRDVILTIEKNMSKV